MKVTSPSKQKPQKFFSAAAERRRRATKIEQNLEMAVAVIQSADADAERTDSHKQDRNVTESKRRVEREGRKKEGKGVKEKLGCYSRWRCGRFPLTSSKGRMTGGMSY